MTEQSTKHNATPEEPLPGKRPLTPAAKRALAEAEARRAAAHDAKPQTEIGGPKGPEPVRYGDWESKGRAIDF